MAKLEDEFKNYIIGLLYPTAETKKFVYEDINRPLEEIIPDDMIFVRHLKDKNARIKALTLLKGKIADFFESHIFYLDYLREIYNKYMFDDVYYWVLVGFVLYRADKTNRLGSFDIFDEKNCILTFDDDILVKANLIKLWQN